MTPQEINEPLRDVIAREFLLDRIERARPWLRDLDWDIDDARRESGRFVGEVM